MKILNNPEQSEAMMMEEVRGEKTVDLWDVFMSQL